MAPGVLPKARAYRGERRPVIERLERAVWHRDEYRLYTLALDGSIRPALSAGIALRRNHWPDLELYEPTAPWWVPKAAFLARAEDRLTTGEHVYTLAAGGRLCHYAWLADRQEATFIQEVDQTFRYSRPGSVLYDAFTHPEARGRGLHKQSFMARLRDAYETGARDAYVGCLARNMASRSTIERTGFQHLASLYRLRALGLNIRWQAPKPS